MSFFKDWENKIIKRLISRIIPFDQFGAGALETNVDQFISYILENESSFWSAHKWGECYKDALREIDKYERRYQLSIINLTDQEADTFLEKMFNNDIVGWDQSLLFFNMLRTHCIYGYLSEPIYQGNKDKLGFKFYGNPLFL